MTDPESSRPTARDSRTDPAELGKQLKFADPSQRHQETAALVTLLALGREEYEAGRFSDAHALMDSIV